jgi:hypothetical protein
MAENNKGNAHQDSQKMRSKEVEKTPDKQNQATARQKKTGSGGGKK